MGSVRGRYRPAVGAITSHRWRGGDIRTLPSRQATGIRSKIPSAAAMRRRTDRRRNASRCAGYGCALLGAPSLITVLALVSRRRCGTGSATGGSVRREGRLADRTGGRGRPRESEHRPFRRRRRVRPANEVPRRAVPPRVDKNSRSCSTSTESSHTSSDWAFRQCAVRKNVSGNSRSRNSRSAGSKTLIATTSPRPRGIASSSGAHNLGLRRTSTAR